MGIIKRLFKIIMIMLVLLFIAISLFLLTFDLNSYKGIITSKASEALGRTVTINKMSMKLSFIPTVALEGIQIDNPKEFEAKRPLLKIDSMDVTLALMPLLKGNIELKEFNLSSATLALVERNNQNNWTFEGGKTKTAQTAQKQKTTQDEHLLDRLRVDNISIKNLSVSYTQNEKTQSVALMNVSVQQLRLVNMTVVYNGKMIQLSGNIGDIAGLALKKPDYSFSLTAEACEATTKLSATIMDTAHFSDVLVTVSVSGKNLRNTVAQAVRLVPQVPDKPFSLEATVRGNPTRELKISPLTLTIGDKSAFVNTAITVRDISADLSVEAMGRVDITDAALTVPFGVKPMNADFDVRADKTKVLIKKLAVNANKSDIAVTGEAVMAAVPVVSAKIAAQYLDPSDFMVEKTPAAAQKTARQKQGGLFSADKIDLSALKLVNGELAASVQHLKIADDYVSAALQAQLKNGDLTVSSFGVRSALGTVTGAAQINAAATPAVMMVKAASDELKLNELKAIQEHLKDSTLSFSAHLQAKGDSVKSFISTLNGRVEAEVSQGTIVNKWFNSLPVAIGVIKNKSNAMSFSESDQVSQLVCGALNLTVKNGVITSANQIAIETSAVDFAVSGDINLPMEQLSLTMVPSLPQGSDKMQSALALTQVVKISGPFSDLKPSLDTKKAAQTVVQAGLGALANKVAERQGIAVPVSSSAQTAADLCEKALGRPLKEQKVQRPVVQTVPAAAVKTPQTEQAVQKQTQKDQFKKQLLNSLSEALKK